MKILKIGGADVICNPLILLAIIIAAVLGAAEELIISFISLSLHEACHTIMANRLGYSVASVEIQPFGFVAKLNAEIHSASDEFAIAFSGPLCSLIAACSAIALAELGKMDSGVVEGFIAFNLLLAGINMLPALPLDGGRIIRSLLAKRMKRTRATRISSALGIAIGIALLTLSVVMLLKNAINATIAIISIFILLSAIKELKNAGTKEVSAILKRSSALKSGRIVDIKHVAANRAVTAGEALKTLSGNKYSVIIIVDDDMRALGEIGESSLLESVSKYGRNISLGAILKLD